MSVQTEKILDLYQKGLYAEAFDACLEYVDACQNQFMEELTVNSATAFAGSVILLGQICALEKKPWKAVPKLGLASGCIRFLEDYIQDRSLLADTCNSFGSAYEYAGFLPEAYKYYLKAVTHGGDEAFLQEAVYSLFLLSFRCFDQVKDEAEKTALEKCSQKSVDLLKEEAKASFDAMLLTDPIEKSEAFLEIRYDLEKAVDEELTKGTDVDRPFCFRYWDLKKKILKEKYGMEWSTPAECNPNVCFQ